MANEIRIAGLSSGLTLRAVVTDGSAQFYNTATSGFEAYNASNVANYAISLTETSTIGRYTGTFPGVAAGLYGVSVYKMAGGAFAASDFTASGSFQGSGVMNWDGSAEVVPANNASLTTMLSHLGSFTGSGVNTVLGFLKALARKDATLPSDIGGTYDPATDSLEAQAEQIASIETSLVSGAVTYIGPILENRDAVLVPGDDYLNADGRSLSWSSDSWPDLTGAAVVLSINTSDPIEVTGTVVNGGSATQTVRFDVASDDSVKATVASSQTQQQYSFRVEATLSNGHLVELVRGKATAKRVI